MLQVKYRTVQGDSYCICCTKQCLRIYIIYYEVLLEHKFFLDNWSYSIFSSLRYCLVQVHFSSLM
jgi:hypothetical protein